MFCTGDGEGSLQEDLAKGACGTAFFPLLRQRACGNNEPIVEIRVVESVRRGNPPINHENRY